MSRNSSNVWNYTATVSVFLKATRLTVQSKISNALFKRCFYRSKSIVSNCATVCQSKIMYTHTHTGCMYDTYETNQSNNHGEIERTTQKFERPVWHSCLTLWPEKGAWHIVLSWVVVLPHMTRGGRIHTNPRSRHDKAMGPHTEQIGQFDLDPRSIHHKDSMTLVTLTSNDCLNSRYRRRKSGDRNVGGKRLC